MKTKNRGNKGHRIPFSVWFWLGFAFVMLVLFYINRKNIVKTVERIQDNPAVSKPQIINEDIKSEVESKKEDTRANKNADEFSNRTALNETASKEDDKVGKTIEEANNQALSNVSEDIEKNEENQFIGEESNKTDDHTIDDKDHLEDTREIELFFATVNVNGTIMREKTKRVIRRSKSPMKDSINALLQGPTKEEAKQGYRSFIPPDAKLLSATIKNGVATLDFNEDFQFNRYGVEGYNIQLQQVISTACTFETVKEVQFLIEGQKRDFLGSEGVWIGSPLTPSSF